MPATKTVDVAKATGGKQTVPLADNAPKADPIKNNGRAAALALEYSWDELPEAAPTTSFTSTGITEDQIPAPIRERVEKALQTNEYYAQVIPDEKARAAFVQFVRDYCAVRKEGRLTARVTIVDDKEVRYSVAPFKDRKKENGK